MTPATSVSRLPTGFAYLETVGMPAVVVPKGTSFWAARDTAIRRSSERHGRGPHRPELPADTAGTPPG